jgi:hypothetical protein
VYDPNSGQRKTRVHTRSLKGFVVVNPRGSIDRVMATLPAEY